MAGICGWLGGGAVRGHAEVVLAAMSAAESARVGAAGQAALLGASAIATRPGVVPVTTYRAGGLFVAIEGRPRWDTEDTTAPSSERSCAALANAYRRAGGECLKHLLGTFALAIIDAETGDGLLAIDRVGIRTLCYASSRDRLVFGSSAQCVAAHPEVGRTLSLQGLFNYLYCHVVPAPGTVYEKIEKLRPGECVLFRKGTVERRFYWQLPYDDGGTESVGTLAPRFRQLLREATDRAIAHDDEIGAFLSGGTDSSTVVGLLTELRGKPANTYSIGFTADGFDEMAYARITAQHFATNAREYYAGPQDVLDAIPLIARAYDEPFGNDSAVPTYLCARLARSDGVRVMLAGDGGDEIFGGNTRYAKQKVFEAYARVPKALRLGLIEPVAFGLPGGQRLAPVRKLASYVRQASTPLPDRLESYNFLERTPLVDVFDPTFLAAVDPTQPLVLERTAYERTASASPLNRMMHLDLEFTLADNDLRKVSRMCELAGVEARYPLLDDAMVAFSGEIAPALKVKGLKLRYFFKEALKDFLPPETLTKAKHGFGMPFGLWLREHKPLEEFVRASLNAFQRRGILRPGYVRELLVQHQTTHATYFGVMIWVIMMLERWLAERSL